jgi:hypothetical protein
VRGSHDSGGKMKSGDEAAFLVGTSVVFVVGHCCFWVKDGWFFILWRVWGLVGVVGGSL